MEKYKRDSGPPLVFGANLEIPLFQYISALLRARKNYQYISEDNNPAIITTDVFISVQEEMKKRSNIVVKPDGTKVRKNTHYSAKRNNRLKHSDDD